MQDLNRIRFWPNKKTETIWYDIGPKHQHAIVSGAKLINAKKPWLDRFTIKFCICAIIYFGLSILFKGALSIWTG